MWLMTPRGFFSVVAHRDDPTALMVRGRARDDLESLAELDRTLEIQHTPRGDYAWRAIVSRDAWSRLLTTLVAEVDYPDFKSEVGRVQGVERASLYARVWMVLRELQRK